MEEENLFGIELATLSRDMFELRPFQKEALEALNASLKNHHLICIAPTGSGKSLIYEQAVATGNYRMILISPLIALARQQFEKLSKNHIPVTLGAGGSPSGPPQTRAGTWIISPEILSFSSRQHSLRQWKPNLLVVDECHCLWEWGDHFRTSFSQIPDLLKHYSIPKSLWLTATLPYEARCKLREVLPQPLTEIGSFDLPSNLFLSLKKVPWKNRAEALLHFLQQRTDSGIVFVSTREGAERVTRILESTGKNIITYHGGMSREERKNAEKLVSQKIPEIVVATSAFGMGMDYPQLSYIALWQAPTSLLSLVQIIGRVGRNRLKKGEAIVLWDLEDFHLLEWTIQNSEKRRLELFKVLDFLSSNGCRKAKLKLYFDKIHDSPCRDSCDFCCH